MAWFSTLRRQLQFGRSRPGLASSFEHCRNIVLTADRYGYDNVLLPSGYQLGIDNTVFAAALAPMTSLRMLLAIRCGEMVVPQLARQLATLDQMMAGRLVINIISSDVPARRCRAPTAIATRPSHNGFASCSTAAGAVRRRLRPARRRPARPHGVGHEPAVHSGGLSPDARECAAAADVFLMWPDTTAQVLEVKADMDARARRRAFAAVWRRT